MRVHPYLVVVVGVEVLVSVLGVIVSSELLVVVGSMTGGLLFMVVESWCAFGVCICSGQDQWRCISNNIRQITEYVYIRQITEYVYIRQTIEYNHI